MTKVKDKWDNQKGGRRGSWTLKGLHTDFFASITKLSPNFNKPKGKITGDAFWMWFIPESWGDTQMTDPNSNRPWHISNDWQMKIHGYG